MNIDALERDLTAATAAAVALRQSTAQTAEAENRVFTADEEAAMMAKAGEVQALRAKIAKAQGNVSMLAELDRLVASAKPAPNAGGPRAALSLGAQFIAAAEYDFFRKQGHRTSAQWRSPSLELDAHWNAAGGHPLAATLTSDPASGGALVVPQYLPGILQLPTRPSVLADLFAQGTTDSNLVSYMREKTFVNAAATVLEGAAKPESTLTFEAAQDAVRKIAHWLPTTEEMLEDAPQIRSYIDQRLRQGIMAEEEDQLLNGTGVAPDLLGLLLRPGLGADVPVGVAPATGMDALLQQQLALYATSYLPADGYVIHPANWAKIIMTKTSTGEYMTAGPFSAVQSPTLWGLPVAVTPAIAAGTALVGAFKTGAQIFRKGGIRVEASNSHQDFFVKNLVAIRAEERLALAVYRPQAFGKVTGLA
jgi:HK97 family phage major capsid protein